MIDVTEPVYGCLTADENEPADAAREMIYTVQARGHRETLRHHVRHSPTGFNHGYTGSGPAELARCILISYLGDAYPHMALYQEFKRHFIAGLPQGQGWELNGALIGAWLKRNDVAGLPWLEPRRGTPWDRRLEQENALRDRFGVSLLPTEDSPEPDWTEADV